MKKIIICSLCSIVVAVSLVAGASSIEPSGFFAAKNEGEWYHYKERAATPTLDGVREYWVKCGGGYQFTAPSTSAITDATGYDTTGFAEDDPRWIKYLDDSKVMFYNLGAIGGAALDSSELPALNGYRTNSTISSTFGDTGRYIFYKDDSHCWYSASTLTVSQVLTAENMADELWCSTQNKNGLYVLGADITTEVASLNTSDAVQTTYSFCGTLDGRGHSISKLTISHPNYGLFGTQNFGPKSIGGKSYSPVIKNLTIDCLNRGSSNYQLRMFGYTCYNTTLDHVNITLCDLSTWDAAATNFNIISSRLDGNNNFTNCVFDCKDYTMGLGAILSNSSEQTGTKKNVFTGTTIKCLDSLNLYKTVKDTSVTPLRDPSINWVSTSVQKLNGETLIYNLADGEVDTSNITSKLEGYSFYGSKKKAAIVWPSTAGSEIDVYALKDGETPYIIKGLVVTDTITTNAELNTFVQDTAKADDSYYVLANDLTSFYTNGTASSNTFKGTFDGLNHTINGFSSWGFGLFGRLDGGAVVKNLNITNICNGYMFAALMKTCTIENVNLSVDKSLSGMGKNKNPLLGYQIEGYTTFKDCIFDLGMYNNITSLLTYANQMGVTDNNTYDNFTIKGVNSIPVFGSYIPKSSGLTYVDNYLVDFSSGVSFTSGYSVKYVGGSDQWDEPKAAFRQLKQHVLECNGMTLGSTQISTDVIASSTKAIIIGSLPSYTAAGLNENDLNFRYEDDYVIKTKDMAVYIMAGGFMGYEKATNRFLQEVLGFEVYGYKSWSYSKDGTILPKMDIVSYNDNLDYFQNTGTHTVTDSSNCAWEIEHDMSYYIQSPFNNLSGQMYHNSMYVIHPDTYFSSHPKWYAKYESSFDGQKPTEYATSTFFGQLCFTARGDSSEYSALVNTIADAMLTQIRTDNATKRSGKSLRYTFGIMDNDGHCECSACKAKYATYGSNAAIVLDLLNDVDDIVQPTLVNESIDPVEILFFCYKNYCDAPNLGTITANKHVHPFIAPIRIVDTKPITNSVNAATEEIFEKWGTCADGIYAWLYETNFDNYLYPVNTYFSMPENINFLKKQGVQYLFMQNNGSDDIHKRTGFDCVKGYLNYCATNDDNSSNETKLNKFFEHYFGDADGYMRTMFESITNHLAQLEIDYPSIATGKHGAKLAQTICWSQSYLNELKGYCDSAYAEAETKYASDLTMKTKIQRNIKVESLFPRWALINLYSMTSLRSDFKTDATDIGMTVWKESNGLLSTVYAEWGI